MERNSDDAKQAENRNVTRIAEILDVLAGASSNGLRLTDVVERTGLGKTTAHRLLGALAANRLVELDADSGRFFLGLKMLGWATSVKNRFGLTRLAEPALERIAQQTHDTIYFVVRVADETVCLDCREGSFPIKVLTLAVGDRRPLGIGAGSLAILSALPDEEIDRVLRTRLDERARFPFDEIQLREMVAATRRQGYAYNNVHLFQGMESVTGMAGIGVAIRRGDGLPVAALHVTSVTSRLEPPRRESVVAMLRAEAAQLEAHFEPLLRDMGRGERTRSAQPLA